MLRLDSTIVDLTGCRLKEESGRHYRAGSMCSGNSGNHRMLDTTYNSKMLSFAEDACVMFQLPVVVGEGSKKLLLAGLLQKDDLYGNSFAAWLVAMAGEKCRLADREQSMVENESSERSGHDRKREGKNGSFPQVNIDRVAVIHHFQIQLYWLVVDCEGSNKALEYRRFEHNGYWPVCAHNAREYLARKASSKDRRGAICERDGPFVREKEYSIQGNKSQLPAATINGLQCQNILNKTSEAAKPHNMQNTPLGFVSPLYNGNDNQEGQKQLLEEQVKFSHTASVAQSGQHKLCMTLRRKLLLPAPVINNEDNLHVSMGALMKLLKKSQQTKVSKFSTLQAVDNGHKLIDTHSNTGKNQQSQSKTQSSTESRTSSRFSACREDSRLKEDGRGCPVSYGSVILHKSLTTKAKKALLEWHSINTFFLRPRILQERQQHWVSAVPNCGFCLAGGDEKSVLSLVQDHLVLHVKCSLQGAFSSTCTRFIRSRGLKQLCCIVVAHAPSLPQRKNLLHFIDTRQSLPGKSIQKSEVEISQLRSTVSFSEKTHEVTAAELFFSLNTTTNFKDKEDNSLRREVIRAGAGHFSSGDKVDGLKHKEATRCGRRAGKAISKTARTGACASTFCKQNRSTKNESLRDACTKSLNKENGQCAYELDITAYLSGRLRILSAVICTLNTSSRIDERNYTTHLYIAQQRLFHKEKHSNSSLQVSKHTNMKSQCCVANKYGTYAVREEMRAKNEELTNEGDDNDFVEGLLIEETREAPAEGAYLPSCVAQFKERSDDKGCDSSSRNSFSPRKLVYSVLAVETQVEERPSAEGEAVKDSAVVTSRVAGEKRKGQRRPGGREAADKETSGAHCTAITKEAKEPTPEKESKFNFAEMRTLAIGSSIFIGTIRLHMRESRAAGFVETGDTVNANFESVALETEEWGASGRVKAREISHAERFQRLWLAVIEKRCVFVNVRNDELLINGIAATHEHLQQHTFAQQKSIQNVSQLSSAAILLELRSRVAGLWRNTLPILLIYSTAYDSLSRDNRTSQIRSTAEASLNGFKAYGSCIVGGPRIPPSLASYLLQDYVACGHKIRKNISAAWTPEQRTAVLRTLISRKIIDQHVDEKGIASITATMDSLKSSWTCRWQPRGLALFVNVRDAMQGCPQCSALVDCSSTTASRSAAARVGEAKKGFSMATAGILARFGGIVAAPSAPRNLTAATTTIFEAYEQKGDESSAVRLTIFAAATDKIYHGKQSKCTVEELESVEVLPWPRDLHAAFSEGGAYFLISIQSLEVCASAQMLPYILPILFNSAYIYSFRASEIAKIARMLPSWVLSWNAVVVTFKQHTLRPKLGCKTVDKDTACIRRKEKSNGQNVKWKKDKGRGVGVETGKQDEPESRRVTGKIIHDWQRKDVRRHVGEEHPENLAAGDNVEGKVEGTTGGGGGGGEKGGSDKNSTSGNGNKSGENGGETSGNNGSSGSAGGNGDDNDKKKLGKDGGEDTMPRNKGRSATNEKEKTAETHVLPEGFPKFVSLKPPVKVVQGFAALVGEDELIERLKEDVVEPFLARMRGEAKAAAAVAALEARRHQNMTKADKEKLKNLEDAADAAATTAASLLPSPPSGILLTGEAGTGKSLLASSLAYELHSSVIRVSPADLMSAGVRGAEKQVVRWFETARRVAPCLLLIEDIDLLTAAANFGACSSGSNTLPKEASQAESIDKSRRNAAARESILQTLHALGGSRLLHTLFLQLDMLDNDSHWNRQRNQTPKTFPGVIVVGTADCHSDIDPRLLAGCRMRFRYRMRPPFCWSVDECTELLKLHVSDRVKPNLPDLDEMLRNVVAKTRWSLWCKEESSDTLCTSSTRANSLNTQCSSNSFPSIKNSNSRMPSPAFWVMLSQEAAVCASHRVMLASQSSELTLADHFFASTTNYNLENSDEENSERKSPSSNGSNLLGVDEFQVEEEDLYRALRRLVGRGCEYLNNQ